MLLLATTVFAQQEADTVASLAGIEIQTSVDRAEIYVGDLITYELTILHDPSIELVPPPLGANLGAFDVKDYESDVRSKAPDGRTMNVSKFILSTFTTGAYVIPPLPVLFVLPDSSRKVVLSEAVPITVKSLLAEGADSADVRPLKAPYEFKRDLTPYYLGGGALILLLLAAGLFVWWWRRRKRAGAPLDLRPAWEIAFERLALLQQRNLAGQEKYKEYYFELTEIARAYLGRMYAINALDMTTEEFLDRFQKEELPPDLCDGVDRFLHHADLVKFARFIPQRERAETDFTFVYGIIEEVRADYQRRQAALLAVQAGSGKAGAVGAAAGSAQT